MNDVKLIPYLAVVPFVMAGCFVAPFPEWEPIDASSAEEYITSWPEMGMWLPQEKQVRFFEENFESSREALRDALSHTDYRVRMRAAFVIGQIGSSARAAGPDLLARLKEEGDDVVRMYIVNALNTIGFDDARTVAELTERYKSLDSANVPPNDVSSYSEVDEKITVAAALYVLGDDDTKATYLTFVTDWLKPPPEDLRGSLLEGYWERRWGAVNTLERMPGAVEAIPLLQSLRKERGAPSWVDVHVPRVLAALRESADE